MITVAASNGTVRLKVTLSSGVGSPMTVTATAPGRETRILRGWDAVTAPAVAVIVDHEAELNVGVRYAVLISGVEVEASTVTLASALPLLSDPIYGRHIPVTIQSWPEMSRETTGHELQVVGNPAPIIIEGVEMLPKSSITLIHPAGSAALLDAALTSSSVLRVRPSCPHLPTEWVSVRSRRRRKFSQRPDSADVDALELTHLGMPAPDTVGVGGTLGDLAAEVPTTLAAIAARWTTLADIAFEDLTA